MKIPQSIALITCTFLLVLPAEAQRHGGGNRPSSGPAQGRPASPAPSAPRQQPAPTRPTPNIERHAGGPAANGAGHAERIRERSEIARELGLSERQQGEINRIREEQRLQIRNLERNSNLDSEQRREQTREAVHQGDQKVRGVLNPEQQRTFDRIMDRDRDRDQLKDRDRTKAQDRDQMNDRDQTKDRDRDRVHTPAK